ncbi:MAG: histidine--tRNA ligase [Planctomycetota bacterium]|nr:histidine--tRNA ligase [Planctomycetota bacterium]
MSAERRSWRAPRGVRDVLPEEIPAWEALEATARRLARLRGYREIRPALLEETDLFTRSVGEVTDVVEKEMFSFQKGESSLSLRPEGTAGIVRAYLQAGYHKTAPVQRLYDVGPMFRYERPQKGRERMFTQFDVETIGSLDPRLDAEIVHLAVCFFEELGISGLEVRLNSMGDGEDRDHYRDAVRDYIGPRLDEYSADSRARFERNVLRILDSKAPQDVELNRDAPRFVDYLSDENRVHFETVQELLSGLGRTIVVDPSIVRGFDYYTRTVFEVHFPELGARSALCGGGRYDHLVRDLGGPDLGAVGFAIGFTATLLVLEQLGLSPGAGGEDRLRAEAYVVAAGEDLDQEVYRLAEELRRAGVSCVYDTERKSLKAQMKAAGRGGHRLALILGPDELERSVVQLKDLAAGEQREVPRARVGAEALRELRAAP